MKDVAIIAFDLYSISALAEAIKIYSIKNTNFKFTIYSNVFSVKNYFKNYENVDVNFIEKVETFDSNSLVDKYHFILDLKNSFKECDHCFYVYMQGENEYSFLFPIKESDIKTGVNFLEKIKGYFNKSFNIDYIETNNFVNQEMLKQLENNPSFKGIISPNKFFKLSPGIHIINEEKLDFLKEFYNALNDKQKEASERKSIGAYFSKMVFSYQKNEAFTKASYDLFSYLIYLKEGTFIAMMSEYASSSDIILLFNDYFANISSSFVKNSSLILPSKSSFLTSLKCS